MNTTFRFGRIAGIDIGVNWTWFAIFGLIVWTLSQNIFPSENPGLGDNTYIAMGAVAALAFFASLLGHELGHAVQARRDGMEIEGITLWLLGGVAKFKGQFPSAGAEFRIAIAGPLVSLVLGVIFVLVAMLPLPGDSRRCHILARLHQPLAPRLQSAARPAARWRPTAPIDAVAFQTKLCVLDAAGCRDRAAVRLRVHRRRHRISLP